MYVNVVSFAEPYLCLILETCVCDLSPSVPPSQRARGEPRLVFEESERRALLLKEWSRYKHTQHQAEMAAISGALEAQRQALEELRLESEELYQAALAPDLALLPFTHQGPGYTAPIVNYEAPEGKYNDISKVYTQ